MGMGDEDLFNLSHLYFGPLDLVLCSLAAVEQPDIAIQSESKRRVISG
jgi:hypothetical protein